MTDRIYAAREAFRNKSILDTQLAHTSPVISHSLHEPHRDFSLSDIILGGQDGLVNVLGVILGVAAASADVRLVQAAGLAATFAESISMAAVAYTSSRAEQEHYISELQREQWEIEHYPEGEREEIRQIYIKRGFEGKLLEDVVKTITANKKTWIEVMMSEELKLQPHTNGQSLRSAWIVGSSAVVGSLIPLLPFFILSVTSAIVISLLLSAMTLFGVGMYKGRITIGKQYRSGIELAVIGIVSALAGYAVGLFFKAPVVP
ncbi:VIT1/CCC1 transporter family protein [Candidatus Gottesmanbacteria bacterium]|nr:VIT1/CCC1 transporter family protein [Candidatus Gottesmanbacteria bacterium]